jgi:hypothetical protein
MGGHHEPSFDCVIAATALCRVASRMPMPSLYLANRIYGCVKSDEIELENGVIHPGVWPNQSSCFIEPE